MNQCVDSTYRSRTPEEVFAFFDGCLRECRRDGFAISRETSLSEWIEASYYEHDWRYGREWAALGNWLNEAFGTKIPRHGWKRAIAPLNQKTLGNACDLISLRAKAIDVEPVPVLGRPLQNSGVVLPTPTASGRSRR